MKIHIVQKGDTLWKIAKKYGVQFEELKQINSQLSNPDMIMPGMKIKIPGTGSAKQTQMMQSNTKINVGSKKEAPIMGTTVSPVKEMPINVSPVPAPVPIPAPVPVPTQPAPVIHKTETIITKEQPMPVMPQPIIPEVDINNYYIANMSNMMVQKPQPKEQPKEHPIVLKPEESPESKVSPAQQPMQPYPVMVDNCVPITPVMPGPGFCPPMHPGYQPYYGPGPVQMQVIQPFHNEESSSMFEPQMPSWHYGAYMPTMTQQPMMMPHPMMAQQPIMMPQPMMQHYGGMYYEPGPVIPHVPLVSAHGLHHYSESSTSHFVGESSSHMMQPPYMTYQQGMPVSIMEEEEEDCGCGGPPLSKTMGQTMTEGQQSQQFVPFQPQPATYTEVQMQYLNPSHMSESSSKANDPQTHEAHSDPQMSGGQSGMMQLHMSGGQSGMMQPQMGGSQAGMYQPQMSGGPGMMQPQMGGSQAGMYQPQMSGGPGMYQPQMGGSQPGMYQPQMGGGQPGMMQPQMNMNQPTSYMPQMRESQSYSPMGNVPFYGQDENMSDIGQLSSYSEAFELPRFADESNE